MGGPIIRTGPTQEFSDNWDRIFGDAPSRSGGAKSKSKSKTSKKAAAPKKKGTKKSPKKSAKKRR